MTGQTPVGQISGSPLPEQAVDLATLQSQVGELRVQLSGLQAQWKGLRVQLDNMLQTNPARPGVAQQWADVGVQIARVEGDIARLDARIAQKQGLPVGVPTTTPPRVPRPFNTNMVIPGMTMVTLALVLPVSLAWARRILRSAPKSAPLPHDLAMRFDRMEQAVDAIAIEVERVSEGQRFVTKVLAARPVQASSDLSPADPLGQAKPPLALGAGPLEPIIVAERERVRQRMVTPH